MALIVTNTTIRHGDSVIIENFSLQAENGTITTIMGPSGCGKSTLLSWIVGSLDSVFQSSGNIFLDGCCLDTVAAHRRNIGILFQDDLLFPHMNVAHNLQFALPSKFSRAQRAEAVTTALRLIEMETMAKRMPYQLSGGQRLRVALMRMLVSRPRAVLLDEPFSKLDQDLKQRIRYMVFARIEEMNVPAIMVTHDKEDAKATGGAIVDFPVVRNTTPDGQTNSTPGVLHNLK